MIESRIDIDVAARNNAHLHVHDQVHTEQIAIFACLLGHALEFPDVPVEIMIIGLLNLDDEQIFLLPDAVYDQVGNDRALANQLVHTETVAQPLDDILAPILFQVDRPADELTVEQITQPRDDRPLRRIRIGKLLVLQQLGQAVCDSLRAVGIGVGERDPKVRASLGVEFHE